MSRKPKPHSEPAFVPMSTRGKPYFATGCVRWTAGEARRAFTIDRVEWRREYRQGWRIVKVRISVLTGGQIKAEKGTRR